MRITIASLSENGGRPHNEDCIGCFSNDWSCCLALADGLGGHGKGEVASAAAIETVEIVSDAPDCTLQEIFEDAQYNITDLQREANDFDSMKTTLVAVLIRENIMQWGHIGDSRLYYFKNKELKKRTLDHSVPQLLVESGEIKESEIRHHEDRNKLLRVLGTEWGEEPMYELAEPVELDGDEQLLLCSDGFWEYITESQMTGILRNSSSPAEWLEKMETLILYEGQNSYMDNYSAICAFIEK